MGGRAFSALGKNAFPRIRPEVYTRLKAHLTERLKSPYKLVGVPIEAPEKEDYGDFDFIVCGPPWTTSGTFDRVKECLGAQHAILQEKSPMANFAIPAGDELGPWESETFFQVDIYVCNDELEWDRVYFLNSYGDLGMILGLIARANGFKFGMDGLKTYFDKEDDRHISSFLLSDSVHHILPFFGLSMEEWERGFSTVSSIFSWVQKSRFFEPQRLILSTKKAARRNMYNSFLQLSRDLTVKETENSNCREANIMSNRSTHGTQVFASDKETSDVHGRTHIDADLLEEALVYFGKKVEYDALVTNNIRRRTLREKLNSTKVSAWTGLQGIAIGRIMDLIRNRLSEDEIIHMRDGDIRKLVLEVQMELGLKIGQFKKPL